MIYELWHTPSANAMSEHPTLAAALGAVREVFETQGERSVGEISLLELDRRGRTRLIAEGAQLLPLIEAHAQRR